MTINFIKKWILPSLIVLLVLITYQLLVSPFINDLRDDWTFLHVARMNAIQQAQQIQNQQKQSSEKK